jgi:hypothetical protein
MCDLSRFDSSDGQLCSADVLDESHAVIPRQWIRYRDRRHRMNKKAWRLGAKYYDVARICAGIYLPFNYDHSAQCIAIKYGGKLLCTVL